MERWLWERKREKGQRRGVTGIGGCPQRCPGTLGTPCLCSHSWHTSQHKLSFLCCSAVLLWYHTSATAHSSIYSPCLDFPFGAEEDTVGIWARRHLVGIAAIPHRETMKDKLWGIRVYSLKVLAVGFVYTFAFWRVCLLVELCAHKVKSLLMNKCQKCHRYHSLPFIFVEIHVVIVAPQMNRNQTTQYKALSLCCSHPWSSLPIWLLHWRDMLSFLGCSFFVCLDKFHVNKIQDKYTVALVKTVLSKTNITYNGVLVEHVFILVCAYSALKH